MHKEIYVWPDGSWVWSEEHSELENTWKGDDFCCIRYVNEDLTEEEIDKLVIKELLTSDELYVLGI